MKRRYVIHAQADEDAIDAVATIAECAEETGYHARTLRFWCDAGYIVARRAKNGVWLVSRASVTIGSTKQLMSI